MKDSYKGRMEEKRTDFASTEMDGVRGANYAGLFIVGVVAAALTGFLIWYYG